jgi:hypothetical protein
MCYYGDNCKVVKCNVLGYRYGMIKERETAAAREADRERKRERARRDKEAGPDAMRKGKYPHCTQ